MRDQLKLNSTLFESDDQMIATINSLEKDHGLGCIVDVVLNHTSYDSEWILQSPEAGYSVENSPHLMSAYELDKLITRFSQTIEQKHLPGYNKNSVDNEEDLRFVIG